MLTKKKSYLSFYLTIKIVFLLSGVLLSQSVLAGAGFSEEGNALAKELREELIKQGVCAAEKKLDTCSLQMYREDGKRIYINMYGQKDTVLASKVSAFYVEKGLKITNGIPITLKVYNLPKSQYLGLSRAIFGNHDEFLKLEINK